MSDYQLIVIGAGPGGYTAALRAAELGLHTAVVENREAGGTCLNRGCVPTKALLHASQIYSDAVTGARVGIHIGDVQVNMPELFAYQRSISQTLSNGVEGLLQKAGVTLLRGVAQILSPGCVSVTGTDGVVTYTADHLLVATGSVPVRPPIPGLELPGVLTSDELLRGSDHLYRSIVIVGGGVIGVEFATFYSELGCDVTLIEGLGRLLPELDRELGQNLALILKKKGVKVCVNSTVQRVEERKNGLNVRFTTKGKEGDAAGEVVLCAIGRRPCWEDLFGPELAPEADGKRLQVTEHFETSIPGVYAIGDVSARIPLAHVAAAQGIACVERLCGKENTVDFNLVPSCIYCRPEIATVGLTEAEAKAGGIPVKVGKCVMGGNARTLIADPGRSFMKLVAHAQTRELLGAQFMCPNATDMISQISQAMGNHLTPDQLLLAMRPHPTFEEALNEALLELVKKLE